MKDKRNKRNRVDEEANFIGDVVRLLFALSIAVVTVVAGFILFKNISGFSLPNLKETEASTEQTKDAVVITEAAKETKKESREEKRGRQKSPKKRKPQVKALRKKRKKVRRSRRQRKKAALRKKTVLSENLPLRQQRRRKAQRRKALPERLLPTMLPLEKRRRLRTVMLWKKDPGYTDDLLPYGKIRIRKRQHLS